MSSVATDFQKCSICGQYGYLNGIGTTGFFRHKCKPCFQIRIDSPEYEEDWHKIFADDIESAAKSFAAYWDNITAGEAELWKGEELKILIYPSDTFSKIQSIQEEISCNEGTLEETEVYLALYPDDEEEKQALESLLSQQKELEGQLETCISQSKRFVVSGEMVPSYFAELAD